ncbi:MAG TPA: delta-60 repeat domain-containing protein [Solirubrobacterales bacterium]|nr:delta-60 repeat domain-containing protein [Solirubrobacterales bacterium]
MLHLRLLLLALSAVVALSAVPAASAAPGDLDPSFGSGGSVRLLPSNEDVNLRAVAVQPDLKIVMAGADYLSNSVILVRLLPSGQLDPTFGSGGLVATPFAGFGEARAIALQPDGKIVIAGAAKGVVNADFLIARYNTDGSPDTGFGGGDGIQLLPIGAGAEEAEAVAIGPGGRILATGWTDLGSSKTHAPVAVLKPNGEPDPAFAGDGTTIVDTTADDSDEGVAIAELADGRILIGDASGSGGGKGFRLVRLLSSGAPDPEFGGGDGIVETPIPSTGDGRITDFALRPDGRIVSSGYGFDEGTPSDSKFAAVGYLGNGELDASFAGTGIFAQQIGAGSDSAQVVQLAPNGKVLLAGLYDAAPGNQSTALLRLDQLGALDPSFGSGGIVRRGVTAPFGEILQDAALDAEERMVVVSTAYIGGGNTEVVVSRYLGDLRPPQPSAPINQPPHARMKKVKKKVAAEKLKGFSGTASDPDGHGVQRVQIALVKRGKVAKAKLRWRAVKGKKKWRLRLKRELRPGRYVVFARAIDGTGLAEAKFSRKLRNRYAFRVLP